MHAFETTVRLQHTNAAGVVFFARFFELAHVAYEDLLAALGHPLPADLAGADPILPIVHAHADYVGALRLGERVRIEIEVREVKSHSFRLGYRFVRAGGGEVAALETVHVAVDRGTGRSRSLPDDLAQALRRV